jgi:ketosteroid isomerase-like protein
MKHASIAIALFVFSQAAMAASAEHDEKDIRRVEKELCDAFKTGDAAAIERIEDSTYTLTNTHGEVSGRADDIADAKKGEIRYSEFRNHDQTVRLYGDAAIVLGITSLKGTANGKSIELDAKFTDTYVRRADGWKIVASQATRLDKK